MDSPSRPWYEVAFGAWYERVYGHRDVEEARRAVELVASRVPLRDRRVLDVASGPGRHLIELAEKGALAVGVDLSPEQTRTAASALRDWEAGPSTGGASTPPVVRADMRRLPFRDGSFELVLSMFTSWGYFEDASEDARAVREAARVLGSRGLYFLDFLNEAHVRRNLVERSTRTAGDLTIDEARAIEESGPTLVKSVRISRDGIEVANYQERVSLYEESAVTGILEREGFTVRERFGDYDGAAYRHETSPRLILLAEHGGPPHD